MKKIQFIEAYNLGSAQAIVRSFSPHNALPQVTTHFHNDERGTPNDIWQSWYYFAHGNRGMIGWVEKAGSRGLQPRPWLAEYRDTLRELGAGKAPSWSGRGGCTTAWPSTTLTLRSRSRGAWTSNRTARRGSTGTGSDHRLGTSHCVRQGLGRSADRRRPPIQLRPLR